MKNNIGLYRFSETSWQNLQHFEGEAKRIPCRFVIINDEPGMRFIPGSSLMLSFIDDISQFQHVSH